MPIPPPDEIEPVYNAATESAADKDSPTDESLDIPVAIESPEPAFNPATTDAAADDESPSDD